MLNFMKFKYVKKFKYMKFETNFSKTISKEI